MNQSTTIKNRKKKILRIPKKYNWLKNILIITFFTKEIELNTQRSKENKFKQKGKHASDWG